MIYQTGSATDTNDLLSIIRTALTANGWTEDHYAADGTGYRWTIHSANGSYFTLRSAINERPFSYYQYFDTIPGYDMIAVHPHRGVDTLANWDQQPGGPTPIDRASTYTSNYLYADGPIPNYFLFINTAPQAVYLVVEWATGYFSHVFFGEVQKFGTWTGGQFLTGMCSPYYGGGTYFGDLSINPPFTPHGSFIRCTSFMHFEDASIGLDNVWAGPYSTSTTEATYLVETRPLHVVGGLGGVGNNDQYRMVFQATSSTYKPYYLSYNFGTGETYFIPSNLWLGYGQAGASTFRESMKLIGSLPDFWHVNMRGLSPKQVLTFGVDEYMAFPVWNKPDPFNNNLSTNYRYGQGFVIKRN